MSENTDLLPESIRSAILCARIFATSKAKIGLTEKEHILGLASLLEKTALQLQAALAQQPAPVSVPDERHPVGGLDHGWKGEYNRGWNACRDAMLAAAPAAPVAQEPVAHVSQETYSADGTSDIITRNLPVGTALYAATPAAEQPRMWMPKDERAVRELLSAMNRDGRQHQNNVGIAQAARDALAEFRKLQQTPAEQADSVKVSRELLRRALQDCMFLPLEETVRRNADRNAALRELRALLA